ncbi:S-adenosyl-L-methionine-dependent methyltransferase [Sordaria brevicollis]|uniref:tRNA wybutosine-synthesizing protein 2 n=1 Tax=Sordaria brevicollis TaxID=83679 RepID=A0AAE0P2W4_SORBR|nr:S-adenosyl-L-methionine-dependent methyltransferase [Sordaria brevicollis]
MTHPRKDTHRSPKPPKKPKQKKQNPITAAIASWLHQDESSHTHFSLTSVFAKTSSTPENLNDEQLTTLLLEKAPKRWVVYEPMVLLPSGSFSSYPWPQLLGSLSHEVVSFLWSRILANIAQDGGVPAGVQLTRLAVNEGIPLHVADAEGSQSAEEKRQQEEEGENLLRSPSGLKMLHGDFGPALPPTALPTAQDFDKAFWVSTKQNGITQIWAPRYTMFSRGNVKEKARLLDFHKASPPATTSATTGAVSTNAAAAAAAATVAGEKSLSKRVRPPTALKRKYALDLYAGIGYFVFSYAKLGMRVLCWEINPWSVEGLRRGAVANKWTVKVFQGEELKKKTTAQMLQEAEGVQIVVFLEGNESAGQRVRELRAEGRELDVLHVNGGFLPTSEKSWRDSWEGAVGKGVGDGWLHLHENVHVKDVESRRAEIQGIMDRWNQELDAQSGGTAETRAVVEHVELVKTFAPDVWHCVFDVYITRCSSTDSSGGGSRPT